MGKAPVTSDATMSGVSNRMKPSPLAHREPSPGSALAELGAAFERVSMLLDRYGGVAPQPEHAPLLVDPEGRIEYATPWFENMFGIPSGTLRGVSIADATSWLGLVPVDNDPGIDGTSTCTFMRPDGSRLLLRLRVVPLVA